MNFDTEMNRVESAQLYSVENCSTTRDNFISYKYDDDGNLSEMKYDTYRAEFSYDKIGRLTGKIVPGGGYLSLPIQKEAYIYRTYEENGQTYTTNQLQRIEDQRYDYRVETRYSEYDESGNITEIGYNGDVYEYTYDKLGRLMGEKSIYGEYIYRYDDMGNIQSDGLTYTNGKLTSVKGKAVEYDELGNPVIYKGEEMKWEQGRKLAEGSQNGKDFIYEYDGNGMRYRKEVEGKTTEYYWNGNELLLRVAKESEFSIFTT